MNLSEHVSIETKEWKSPPLYMSTFNKIRKVHNGILYVSEPFDPSILYEHPADVELARAIINDKLNETVINLIKSNNKIPG